jgi:FeS assembly protein IscX
MNNHQLTWNDADELGILLSHNYPQIEPLSVRLSEVLRLVTQLTDFHDDPSHSDTTKLQAIQEAWHAEFLDRTQA